MIKLFGPRIAVKKQEQKFDGRIALPPNRHKLYDLGEVVAASSETNFKPGQLIFFQLFAQAMENAFVHIDGQKEPLIIMHHNDVLARLDSLTITVDTFKTAGRYLLLKPFLPKTESIIVIPDSAEEPHREMLRYTVAQIGDRVDTPDTAKLGQNLDVKAGDEVYPDRGRCNPLQIGKETFVFVDRDFILGVKKSEAEICRDEIDAKFIAAGHKPEDRSCDHSPWRELKEPRPRHCPKCGTCI